MMKINPLAAKEHEFGQKNLRCTFFLLPSVCRKEDKNLEKKK
jgi:hypothetical protein